MLEVLKPIKMYSYSDSVACIRCYDKGVSRLVDVSQEVYNMAMKMNLARPLSKSLITEELVDTGKFLVSQDELDLNLSVEEVDTAYLKHVPYMTACHVADMLEDLTNHQGFKSTATLQDDIMPGSSTRVNCIADTPYGEITIQFNFGRICDTHSGALVGLYGDIVSVWVGVAKVVVPQHLTIENILQSEKICYRCHLPKKSGRRNGFIYMCDSCRQGKK